MLNPIVRLPDVKKGPKKCPPSSIEDLRKISGLKTLSKIAEKMLGEYIIWLKQENYLSMVTRKR